MMKISAVSGRWIVADTKKQKINPFYWKFFLVSTGLFIFWILFSQSFEYRFFKAKWDENLVTFDQWKLVSLKCRDKYDCIESGSEIKTPFFNDKEVRDFRNRSKSNSFRIKAKLKDIKGIESILKDENYSIVVPKTETSYVNLMVIKKEGDISKKRMYHQINYRNPISFHFEKENETYPVLSIEDEIEIDFHLLDKGILGTKTFPIGFVKRGFHADYFNSVNPISNQDFNGELQMILGITMLSILIFLKRNQSSYIPYLGLFLCISGRSMFLYLIEIFNFSQLAIVYLFFQIMVSWYVIEIYLQSKSVFWVTKYRKYAAIFASVVSIVSLNLIYLIGFNSWIEEFWLIDPCFSLFPLILVLFYFAKNIVTFISSSSFTKDLFFKNISSMDIYKRELTSINVSYSLFGLLQIPVFLNNSSTSMTYSHALFMFLLLFFKEASFLSKDQKLMIDPESFDKDSVIQVKIESLKATHPQPFLVYLKDKKIDLAIQLSKQILDVFNSLSKSSAIIRVYQDPKSQTLCYHEFLLTDLLNPNQNQDLMITSAMDKFMSREEISEFVIIEKNKVTLNVFSNHSLSDFPYFSLCFEKRDHAPFYRSGEVDWLLKAIKVFSYRMDLLLNHVNRMFHENDPVLKGMGYQSILQVKPDFTFQRHLPALMIDVRGYSKLILQKNLGCYDKNGMPLALNHSQILNLLFRPFLDLSYKNKMARIGPNGDSLILFGPVDKTENHPALVMLKTALDAKELYDWQLEEFRHQVQLHPDCVPKITLQFGRALGFGEINVNLIGGSYTGQLDYHTETINLLARVEKFTKKMNADCLLTQDFLDVLNREVSTSPSGLHDVMIRYLGSYQFDASVQKVKLYQVGYSHKCSEFFSQSDLFDEAISHLDSQRNSDALRLIEQHLLRYPKDGTAMAIKQICSN